LFKSVNFIAICFLGTLISSVSLGQELSLNTNASKDSLNTYFVDVSDSLMVNARMLMRSYSLNYYHVNSGTNLQVEPTGQVNLGLGFNYKWFGLAYNVGLPSSAEEVEKYGETERQDLHIGMYGDFISGSINLQHYKGFHISNYQDTNSGNQIKIPSMKTYNINFSALYFFNHKKFSYKAAYVRNAVQKKSAGSFVAGGYLTYDISESNVPVGGSGLPDSIATQFDVLGVWSRTYGVSLGYSHTFVIKKRFFVNGTLVPGIGAKKLTLNLSEESVDVDAGTAYRLDGNLSLGYEADNWLAGMSATTSNQIYEIDGLRISPNSSSLKLFVAKRFGIRKRK
jgi:hypothetical protein